jgi:hypothetical protein
LFFLINTEEQRGFREERRCIDQTFTLAQTVLKRLEKKKDTYLCFIDLRRLMLVYEEKDSSGRWSMKVCL